MTIQDAFGETMARALLSQSPDQLYELLGMRAQAVEEDIRKLGSFEPEVAFSQHMGYKEDLQKIGRRMFNKVHVQAYGLVCGSNPDDREDRDRILGALGISIEAAVIAVASVLVNTFGLAAAFAGVVAALIMKRFAEPTLEEGHRGMCELWSEYLPTRD